MKKALKILVVVALFVTLSATLIACGSTSSSYLDNLKAEFASVSQSASSLDMAEESDLSSKNVTLSTEVVESLTQSQSIIYLTSATMAIDEEIENADLEEDATDEVEEETVTDDSELTTGQKVVKIYSELSYIKEKQYELEEIVADFNIEKENFTTNVKTFYNLDIELSEDDAILIADSIDEVIALREAIDNTIGKVYGAINEAKDLYTLETIDEALEVLDGVIEQMDIRVNSASRIDEIAIEMNSYLTEKINAQTTTDSTQM
jgi:hypothetical protein